jgi:hypothetical protein
MDSKRCHGLTLVEALIVLVFVGVLIYVFLVRRPSPPAGGRRCVVCLCNLKNISTATTTYAVMSRDLLPWGTSSATPHWTTFSVKMLGDKTPYTNPNQIPFDKRPLFQCPERSAKTNGQFIDYVSNAMNPDGVDSEGKWTRVNTVKMSRFRKPSEIICVADMEREEKNTARAGESLSKGRELWTGRDPNVTARTKGIEIAEVWCAEQLPEGMDGINTNDGVGPRRVARKMHLQRQTNTAYLDGHAGSVQFPPSRLSDSEKYAAWLTRFGVKDSAISNMLKNLGPYGQPNDAIMHGLNPSQEGATATIP